MCPCHVQSQKTPLELLILASDLVTAFSSIFKDHGSPWSDTSVTWVTVPFLGLFWCLTTP
jgi:hypothetical protein